MKANPLSISDLLLNIDDGSVLENLSVDLREVVRAAQSTGKAGSVTLKLAVKPNGAHSVGITDKITKVVPQADPSTTNFFVCDDGGLSVRDPRQPMLEGMEANR